MATLNEKAAEFAADLDTVVANLTGDAESHTLEECARIIAEIASELRDIAQGKV